MITETKTLTAAQAEEMVRYASANPANIITKTETGYTIKSPLVDVTIIIA